MSTPAFQIIKGPKVAGKDKKEDKKNREVASDYDLGAPTDPKVMGEELVIGPIPAGVPINLIVNANLSSDPVNLAKLNYALLNLGIAINRTKDMTGSVALKEFMKIAGPSLIAVSKCSDFVVNRGHYFGSQYDPRLAGTDSKGLSAEEKSALIEYLKYFLIHFDRSKEKEILMSRISFFFLTIQRCSLRFQLSMNPILWLGDRSYRNAQTEQPFLKFQRSFGQYELWFQLLLCNRCPEFHCRLGQFFHLSLFESKQQIHEYRKIAQEHLRWPVNGGLRSQNDRSQPCLIVRQINKPKRIFFINSPYFLVFLT